MHDLQAAWQAADQTYADAVVAATPVPPAAQNRKPDDRERSRELARRVLAVERGEIQFPARCSHCQSASVTESEHEGMWDCVQCGRATAKSVAGLDRRQRIRNYLDRGELPK